MKINHFFLVAIFVAIVLTLSACGPDPCMGHACGDNSSSSGCTAANNNSTEYCSNGTMKEYGFVTYEGQIYKTVEIGEQTWFQRNLNYALEGSKCSYSENTTTCDTYGRLYDWATAMDLPSSCNSSSCSVNTKHQGICPSGWHIPSSTEWTTLANYVGGYSTAGKYLKTSDWDGNDKYGFAALPHGEIFAVTYCGSGSGSKWWTTLSSAIGLLIEYDGIIINISNCDKRTNWFGVRCIKD